MNARYGAQSASSFIRVARDQLVGYLIQVSADEVWLNATAEQQAKLPGGGHGARRADRHGHEPPRSRAADHQRRRR